MSHASATDVPARVLPSMLRGLALTGVALGVLLGLLEIALRLRPARPSRATSLADYSEYDPDLGWRKRPGVAIEFARPEYRVPFETNSLGLRDRERSYQAAAGYERILALGDSFVEGYTVALENTVTQRLERDLGERGCRVDVINGATTGYSTDQEYVFYGHEGVRYSPRVVLLFFYQNDVYFNDASRYYEGVSKPVFVFRAGRLELWKSPVPTPAPRPPPQAADGESGDTGSPLQTVEWIKERLWFGAPRLYNRLGRLGLWAPNRPIGARLEQRVYSREVNPQLEGGWEKTDAILGKLAEDVRGAGRLLLVVYIPARFEVNDRVWRLTAEKYDIRDLAGWDRGLVRMRLGAIARRASVPMLDLTPALRAAERGFLGAPYFDQDGHWNALGHDVAAREVSRFLGEAGWLSTCPRPRTSGALERR